MIESSFFEMSQGAAIQAWMYRTGVDLYVGVPAGFLAAIFMLVFAFFKRASRFLWSFAFVLFMIPLLCAEVATTSVSFPKCIAIIVFSTLLAVFRPRNPQHWYTRLAVATIGFAMLAAILLFLAAIFCSSAGAAGYQCGDLAKALFSDFLAQFGI
jgi:hypothetical protein